MTLDIHHVHVQELPVYDARYLACSRSLGFAEELPTYDPIHLACSSSLVLTITCRSLITEKENNIE